MFYPHLREHGVNNVFARTLPKRRAKRDLTYKFFCISSFFIGGSYFSHDQSCIYYLATTFCSCYIVFFTIEMIQRLCSLAEERHHVSSRYNNSTFLLLKEVFSFNLYNVVCVCCSAVYSLLNINNFNVNDFGILAWAFSIVAMGIFVKIIRLNWSHLSLAHHVDYLNGMDCGTFMAFSYFYGYLDIVVPNKGNETKGLKEHMLDYQGAHGIEFAATKLYIFIPLSGYCPINLSEQSHKFLFDTTKNLEYNTRDKSGVRGREYHNSVYKIIYDKTKTPYYVCAEYASPVNTLFNITERSIDVAGLYKKYHTEIITKFYTTLDNIINSTPQMKDLVELIFFNDLDATGRTLSKDELDIADLLLERLPKKQSK